VGKWENLIMEILTTEEIEQDILNYQARITAARRKLQLLPAGYLPFQEHKKREKVRRDLVAECHHVKTLIKIANDGLQIMKGV